MTYEEALSFIHQTDWKGSRLGLDRMRELMGLLGNPQERLRFIHVAGTNGKGSTCAMLASVLTAAGYRTGMYISPHLVRVNERISVNGSDISDSDLIAAAERVRDAAGKMEDQPTEFEIITAMAAQGRLTKAGRPFGKNSLHEVLKNEKYIGVLEYGAVPSVSPTGRRNNHQPPAEGCVRLEGAVPRIISDELWAEVQKRMKERTHLGGRYSAKVEYLLSGKVFCGECGGAMVVAGTSSGARGQRYRYYSCVHKRQTKTCSAKGISVPKLEQLVAEAVKRQLASPEGLRDVISAAAQYRDALTQAAAPRTDELTRQIQDISKKICNLVDTLANGISSKAITDQLAKLEDEKARLEAAERNIKAATREVGLTDAEIAEGLTKLSMTDESTQDGRRVLLSIVARVVVFADHVDVYTILGPDGKKPDLDTAAKDFITTMGETSLAP